MFLLISLFPEAVDIEDLVALDHLVVHSQDVGGPNSLHPATEKHATEMLVRREVIQNGLLLMQTRSMIERIANEHGIFYRAGDEAHNFVGYLNSPYFQQMRQAAEYLVRLRNEVGKMGFTQLVEQQLERWAIQFQSREVPGMPR